MPDDGLEPIVFREIIAGHAPHWAFEAAHPRDFSALNKSAPPAVAFMALNLSPAIETYLDNIDFDRDILRDRPKTRGCGTNREEDRMDYIFTVNGWGKNPRTNEKAHRSFLRCATPFFPPAPEREPLVAQLAKHFSKVAKALKCGRMNFQIRSTRETFIDSPDFHEDKDVPEEEKRDEYTIAAYLRGETTVHLAPNTGRYRPDEDEGFIYASDLSARTLAGARLLPKRSIAAWNEEQPHAAPSKPSARITVFGFSK